jgi:hypothetical protein
MPEGIGESVPAALRSWQNAAPAAASPHDREPCLFQEVDTVQPAEYDLATLLGPREPETFFRDSWEKQPLHVPRNQPAFYQGLFSLRDVDSVIAFSRPKFLEPADFEPAPRPVHNFVQGYLADDEPFPVELYPDISDVHQAFRHGKTVIITNMQYRWAPIAGLCRRLEAAFGCPVHGNLYLTPRGAQGFSAHYDTHDVFVLQLEGSKHWRFYGTGPALPLVDDKTPVAKDRLGPPTLEAVVQPGDLLYMPRGHIHEAFTSECASMHLTVGVKVYRWVDLLQQALANVSALDVRFRESLPPATLTSGQTSWTLKARFHELLELLLQAARAEDAVDRLGFSFVNKLSMLPNNAFVSTEANDAERIDLDTEVERAPGALCRVVETDGEVSLGFPGNRLDGPGKIASALRFMARTRRFTVRALPDDLTAEAKLLLVRRLIRDRFLTVASQSAPDSSSPPRASGSSHPGIGVTENDSK